MTVESESLLETMFRMHAANQNLKTSETSLLPAVRRVHDKDGTPLGCYWLLTFTLHRFCCIIPKGRIKHYIIMSFFDKMKKASKGVVDAGAKQMLKVRCAFALFSLCCAAFQSRWLRRRS